MIRSRRPAAAILKRVEEVRAAKIRVLRVEQRKLPPCTPHIAEANAIEAQIREIEAAPALDILAEYRARVGEQTDTR